MLVDALACFDIQRHQIQVLSLGCDETAFKVGTEKMSGDMIQWRGVIQAAMKAQSHNAIGQAGRLAGLPAEKLERAAIIKADRAFQVRGQRVVAATLRVRRLAACPACLKADVEASDLAPYVAAYGRLVWKLAPVGTCPINQIGLVDHGAGAQPRTLGVACGTGGLEKTLRVTVLVCGEHTRYNA